MAPTGFPFSRATNARAASGTVGHQCPQPLERLSAKCRGNRSDCRVWSSFIFRHIDHAADLQTGGKRSPRSPVRERSDHGGKVLLTAQSARSEQLGQIAWRRRRRDPQRHPAAMPLITGEEGVESAFS